MKSALIIGGDSMIGSAIGDSCREAGVHVESTSRQQGTKAISLDLAHNASTWGPIPAVEVAYFCAAISKLDICEMQPFHTSIVNVQQTRMLCEKIIAQGTRIVFLSSNHVFDGEAPMKRTTDLVDPQSVYGKQKAALEAYLLAQEGSAAVLRLTKVVPRSWLLIQRWERALRRGEVLSAFTDLVFAPISLSEVAASAITLGMKGHTGIFHLSGDQDLSYYEAAKKLAESLNLDSRLVQPATAAEQGIPLRLRPPHTTLLTSQALMRDLPPLSLISDNCVRNRGLKGEALDF